MDRGQDIRFVYENGVLRPEEPVNLPEGARGVAHIHALEDGGPGFWENPTLAQLRAQQRPLPVESVKDLVGDWPEDESIDEFVESLRHERK